MEKYQQLAVVACTAAIVSSAITILATSGRTTGAVPRQSKRKQIDPVIVDEALARHRAFFNDDLDKIRNSFVVIVGLGGVGSAAASMLVRGGVGRVRIIDFDQVSLSSMNRHAVATLANIGTPKVEACKEHYNAIAPWVDVEARCEMFTEAAADRLLEGNPDYVLDCIDNVDTKATLLHYCHSKGIKVMTSLGAACKSDASVVQLGDISESFEDPLGKVIRRLLRLKGVHHGIPAVFSTEKPREELGLIPLSEEEFKKGKVSELSAFDSFRVRILPVLGPMPAMFGNAMASYVLQQLAGFKMEPLPFKNRHKMAATLHRQLSVVELRLNDLQRLPINESDLQYIYEEVFRVRSAAPLNQIPARPCILRWDKNKGLEFDNLVVFERDQGALHLTHCLEGDTSPEKYWGDDISNLVHKRFNEERRIRNFRL